MKKTKHMRNLSVLQFIVLVVLLCQLATASPTILSVSGKGTDNIRGVIRAQDTITFEAVISPDGNTIVPTQVVLGSDIQFTACNQNLRGEYVCTVQDATEEGETFNPSEPLEFQIKLLNFSNGSTTLFDLKNGELLIDSNAPSAQLLSIEPQVVTKTNATVRYSARDTACDFSACSGVCSGLKSAEFYINTLGSKKILKTVNISSSACTSTGSVSIPSSAFPEGKIVVYMRVLDGAGQFSKESSIDLRVDNIGPKILDSTFSITAGNEKPISHYRTNLSTHVYLNIMINDSDLDKESVIGDFSSLNAGDSSLKKMRAFCVSRPHDDDEPINDTRITAWACQWEMDMYITNALAKKIVINASDAQGNVASSSITKNLVADDTGPTLSSLSAGNGDFASLQSTIVGQLVEVGSGVNPLDMFLRVESSKGCVKILKKTVCSTLPPTTYSATMCNSTFCTWEGVVLGGDGNFTLTLDSSSKDVLGNPAKPFSRSLLVSTSSPVVANMTITGVGGLSNTVGNIVTTGDKILVIANISEDTSIVSALADFSDFIPGLNESVGECTKIAGTSFSCTWTSDPVEKSNAGKIRISLRDISGNSVNATGLLTTYPTDDNSTPNYWTNTVTCTPEVLDRSIGPLISQKVYCTVKLSSNTSRKTQTVSLDLKGCTDNKLISESKLFNTQKGSTTPLLKLTLAKGDLKIDEIKTTCTLGILSKVDNSFTKSLEEEQVLVTIKFFNNPLGTVDNAVQEKLDKALKSTEGLSGFIGTLNKILYYAKQACNILNTYYSITNALYAVTASMGVVSESTCSASKVAWYLQGVCEAMKQSTSGSCTGQQVGEQSADATLLGGVNKLCKIANCEWTPEIISGLGDKVTEAFNGLPYLEGQFPKNPEVGQKAVDIATSKRDAEISYLKTLPDDPRLIPKDLTSTEKDKIADKARPVFDMKVRDLSGFPINVRSSFTTSIMFGCIPGIIENIDKYRQINCLYADCIQTAVMEDNVPLKVCEDLKAEATCKYIMGEVFAIVPYTAIFDKMINTVKGVLNNPLSGLSLASTAYCWGVCNQEKVNPFGFTPTYAACANLKLASKVGYMIEQIIGIINQGFFPQQPADYCKIVSDRANGGESKGLFGGLFGGSSKKS